MPKSFLNMAGYPLGLRNNNPGNLVASGINWQGAIGTNSGFVVFSNIIYGLRALARDIENDMKEGKTTVSKIIYEFAPPNENNTNAYIDSVCKTTGFSRYQVLEINGTTIAKLIRGIIIVEIGPSYASLITDADIQEGIKASNPTLQFVAIAGVGLGGLFLLALAYLVMKSEN